MLFYVPRDALCALGEGASIELGPRVIEPLTFSASLRLSGGEVFFALSARAPSLAPYGAMQLEGEVGLVDQLKELWRARAFGDTLAAPQHAPEARFAAVNFGRRDYLLRRSYWKSEAHVVLGLLLGRSRLLPASGGQTLPIFDRPLAAPGFIVLRLQAENAALKAQARQLGAALDAALEAACPTTRPAPPDPAAELAAAVRAAVSRDDITGLRGLRAAVAGILAAADEGLGDAGAGDAGAGDAEPDGAEPGGAQAELCCVCLDRLPDTRFLPCAHACCCSACAAPLAACPLCRSGIAEQRALAAS